jgi:hypothetical protein
MKKSIYYRLASLLLALGAFSPTAQAVNDLPGGPAVRQLNLHPAASRIAVEQAWLHWFMLIASTVIFVAVFSVMFYSIWKHRKSVELMAIDALNRRESCGGHFREESQTEEGEALRDDNAYCHVAAWEYKGDGAAPELHTESLSFENVKLTQRSYK